MSIDAVAVLRIANLPPPPTSVGTNHLVEHRGEATLLHTFNRFEAADPDEHALALRRLLDAALDAHDDPRGILFYPDVCEPKGASYDAIVRELASAGKWVPKVDADYVPVRYRGTPRQPHDVLVGELIGVIGRDAALQLDMLAQVNKALLVTAPDRLDAAEAYRQQVDAVTRAMEVEFARRYETSLQVQVEAIVVAQNRSPISLVDLDVTNDVNELLANYDRDAPASGHEALTAEMIKVMGRDDALKQNLMAWDGRIAVLSICCSAHAPRNGPHDDAAQARGHRADERLGHRLA